MRKAQSTLEYAVVIFCVVAALIASSAYIRRGVQGRYKQVADDLGQQYAPGKTESNITLESSGHVITEVTTSVTPEDKLATTTKTTIESESERRHGKETIKP